MKNLNREDSRERRHYIMERMSFLSIKSKLLYSGSLSKVKGWNDKPHSHNFLEILCVQDGKGIINIEEKQFPIYTGDIVIYNAGVTHYEKSSVESPIAASFIAFDNVQLKDMPKNCILPEGKNCIFNTGRETKNLIELFKILRNEISVKDDFYVEIADNISRTILIYILRIINSNQNIAKPLYIDKSIEKVLEYIDDNYLDSISLDKIAQDCFINKYHLSHLFSEQVGITVGQYILNKKLEFAKTLLRETKSPINIISIKCGFNDISYFARTFKKHIKCTPVQYRNKYIGKSYNSNFN